MKPTPSPVRKAGKRTLRLSGAAIATSESALETSGSTLEDRVDGDADRVLDAEELAEFIEERQGKASIGAQLDPNSRKFLL